MISVGKVLNLRNETVRDDTDVPTNLFLLETNRNKFVGTSLRDVKKADKTSQSDANTHAIRVIIAQL